MKNSEVVSAIKDLLDGKSGGSATDYAGSQPYATAASGAGVFQRRGTGEPFAVAEQGTHKLGPKVACDTDRKGFATPNNLSPTEIVLDASEGFVPLWAKGVTLHWRFNEASMGYFQNPEAAKNAIRQLFSEAVLAWGDAAPIKFKETDDVWDFQIVMRSADNCNGGGCVLASAFFPDAGRHDMVMYPRMFTQVRKEQVDTIIHEIGHTFGLRHFFAAVRESAFPSEVFGTHSRFSIMNYGALSELTETDKSDLKNLYQLAWSGELTEINGTPIRFFEPYHTSGMVVWPSMAGLRRAARGY